MALKRQAYWLIGACLVGCGALMLRDASAAPNYYSGEAKSKPSQLRVTDPKAGTVTAGDKILIQWRKSTPGTEVTVSIHQATGSGAAGPKVQDVDPPASVKAEWKTKGGALYWSVPKTLPPGRYLVQVRAGSFLASSEAFLVNKPKEKVPELGAEQTGPKGRVAKVDVQDKGATGSVIIKSGGDEKTYEWGKGSCPALGGGLPGALAMMATLDDAQITPRYREAALDGQVKQLCIVGLIAENKPVPEAE